MGFFIQNSDFMTRINSLYGSQTSPVVLCMKNSVITTRITSLHGSQTSPVVLCMQNNVISIRITSPYGSLPSPGDFAYKRATFGTKLEVSMGPRLRPLICEMQNCLTIVFWSHPSSVVLFIQNSDISTKIASLYRCQTSHVVLCVQTEVISVRITSLSGSLPTSVVLCLLNNMLTTRINSLYGSWPHLWLLPTKQRA